jgi:type I restriction enzyme M protein
MSQRSINCPKDMPTNPSRLLRTSTDPLGRYYTFDSASRLLIQQLQGKSPRRILDLGAGAGSLTLAARREWKHAQIITVDIDDAASTSLAARAELGNHTHFNYDALKLDLPEILGGADALSDLAICNPPFARPTWRKEYYSILEEAGLSGCYPTLRDATAEVLFLAQNLRLIRDKGSLGIIVPDGIVSGKKHEKLRAELIRSHGVESVIKLPRRVFAGTDAQAFIITLTKNGHTKKQIELRHLTAEGKWNTPIFVDNQAAKSSFDFAYNSIQLPEGPPAAILSDLIISLRRGNVVSSERNKTSHQVFHVTDFPEEMGAFSVPKQFRIGRPDKSSTGIFARKGDIILARVGRNLESKLCYIKDGNMEVTDCVYVIRAAEGLRERIFSSLRSSFGRLWFSQVAHGVSARHLPKCDLLNFPVQP